MTNDRHPDDETPFAVVDRRPVFNDETTTAPEARYPTVVEQLRTRAEEAEQRAREISAAYRRIEQERDAFRERLTRDLERRVDLARAEMLRKIIGVVDDLDRAIAAARGAGGPAPLLAGVSLIRERLAQILASEGAEAIETVGKQFDPSLAEAVATEESDDPGRDNQVVEEMERGYTLRGTLLRAARVKVARSRVQATAEAEPETE